jgi:hypothetical protein
VTEHCPWCVISLALLSHLARELRGLLERLEKAEMAWTEEQIILWVYTVCLPEPDLRSISDSEGSGDHGMDTDSL